MNVSLNEIDEPIVVLNLAQSSMQKERVGIAANKDEAERSKLDSKYFQPRWCPSGLTKTQQRKLHCARCKKIKQEA